MPTTPTAPSDRQRRTRFGNLLGGTMLSLLLASSMGGCANDAGAGEETITPELAVDPASQPSAQTNSSLSDEERALLLRARGRDWESVPAAELQAFLNSPADSTRAVYLWNPNAGAEALREAQLSFNGLDSVGISVAVAVVEGGNLENELIELRYSQIVAPAWRIPASGDYSFLPGGQLPTLGTLIVSGGPKLPPVTFPAATPPSVYGSLLLGMRPE